MSPSSSGGGDARRGNRRFRAGIVLATLDDSALGIFDWPRILKWRGGMAAGAVVERRPRSFTSRSVSVLPLGMDWFFNSEADGSPSTERVIGPSKSRRAHFTFRVNL